MTEHFNTINCLCKNAYPLPYY